MYAPFGPASRGKALFSGTSFIKRKIKGWSVCLGCRTVATNPKKISVRVPELGRGVDTFEALRPRIEKYIMSPPDPGVKFTNFPKFSSIIGGLRPGELTLLTGPTGSGKTSFLSQLTVDLAFSNVRSCWGSFEITRETLMYKMLHQVRGQGKDLTEIEYDFDDVDSSSEREEELSVLELLESLNVMCENGCLSFMDYFGQNELTEVLHTMNRAVTQLHAQHIVIDNLQFMLSAFAGSSFDSKFVQMDNAIGSFRKFATEKNVHVTVVIHPRKENDGAKLGLGSVYGTGKATQEADNVLILQRNSDNETSIDVRKNRFSGNMGSVRLEYNHLYKMYYEHLDE